MDAISQSENPAIPFNPAVLVKSFGLKNLLTYLWCDLAMLVGLKQEPWTRYNQLVPLKIWNCREPVIYGKLQNLSMEAGTLNPILRGIKSNLFYAGGHISPPMISRKKKFFAQFLLHTKTTTHNTVTHKKTGPYLKKTKKMAAVLKSSIVI